MENQFPKNVRQIGNVSDVPKIYVEDYVDTFLNQICDKAEETPIGAFLLGHAVSQEEQECIYISGAVQIEFEVDGQSIGIGEEAWISAEKERKEYFDSGEIIGWFACLPGRPLLLNDNLTRIHEQNFGRAGTVLIMKEPEEKEELYFTYKYRELMQMGGHYIYYEKNPSMQNYMVVKRKQNGVTPSEMVEDQAAKDFRSIVRERYERKEQRRSSRMMYVGSVLLVLIVLVIGVTTVNNYDKMRAVQSSLEDISQSVEQKQKAESVEANAQVAGTKGTDDAQGEKNQSQEGNDDAAITDGAGAEGDTTAAADDTAEGGDALESTMQEMTEDIYVVEKGDTLAKISKKIYGDIGHVDAICRMNGLSDGNLIFIGQKLLLP